jgi:hypothetical protein
MMFKLKSTVIALLLLASPLTLTGCASTTAETPAQRVYALQSEYAALLAAAVAYESQPRCIPPQTSATAPCSQADWVEEIRKADDDAYAAIREAQNIVRDPNTTGGISTALSVARSALNVLNQVLVTHHLIGAPTATSMYSPPMSDRDLVQRTLPHSVLFPSMGVQL